MAGSGIWICQQAAVRTSRPLLHRLQSDLQGLRFSVPGSHFDCSGLARAFKLGMMFWNISTASYDTSEPSNLMAAYVQKQRDARGIWQCFPNAERPDFSRAEPNMVRWSMGYHRLRWTGRGVYDPMVYRL